MNSSSKYIIDTGSYLTTRPDIISMFEVLYLEENTDGTVVRANVYTLGLDINLLYEIRAIQIVLEVADELFMGSAVNRHSIMIHAPGRSFLNDEQPTHTVQGYLYDISHAEHPPHFIELRDLLAAYKNHQITNFNNHFRESVFALVDTTFFARFFRMIDGRFGSIEAMDAVPVFRKIKLTTVSADYTQDDADYAEAYFEAVEIQSIT